MIPRWRLESDWGVPPTYVERWRDAMVAAFDADPAVVEHEVTIEPPADEEPGGLTLRLVIEAADTDEAAALGLAATHRGLPDDGEDVGWTGSGWAIQPVRASWRL